MFPTLLLLQVFQGLPQAAEVVVLAPTDPVAVQLYVFGEASRHPNEQLDEVLATVKRCGYSQVQAWLDYFDSEESAKVLDNLLKKHGLTLPAAYSGANLHDPEQAEKAIASILSRAKRGAEHGLRVVVVNPDPIQGEKTDDQLMTQAKNLDRLGKALAELGLRLAIHQHAPEMASGAREWYHMLRNTDPERVFFCLDTHWVLRGGQDPYQLLEDAGNRVIDLHLRNSTGGVWAEELGDGDIDYRKVSEILERIGYRGYLTVELAHEKGTQVTRSLEENLKRSREYVREVFGR
ncbi:MAG: Inosose dehydratase [bacterium]|nr:Inosose dehydratase [bacterium]